MYIHTMFSVETNAADDIDDYYNNEDDTYCSNYYAYEHSIAIITTVTYKCKVTVSA